MANRAREKRDTVALTRIQIERVEAGGRIDEAIVVEHTAVQASVHALARTPGTAGHTHVESLKSTIPDTHPHEVVREYLNEDPPPSRL